MRFPAVSCLALFALAVAATDGFAQTVQLGSETVRQGSGELVPASPILTAPVFQKLGALELHGTTRRLDLENGVAYLAQEFFGIAVVDVSDPLSPSWVSEVAIPTSTGVYDLDVDGGFLYVAANEAGLLGFDVRVPEAPVLLFQVPSQRFGGSVLGVHVRDGRLYVSAGAGGISVWDVSDPEQFDATLYCAGGMPIPCPGGDCSDASLLGCHRDFPLADYYRDVVVEDGLLIAATALGGIVALDVNDPALIVPLAKAAGLPGSVIDVARSEGVAYGASIGYGLVAADLSALPLGPVLPVAGQWATGGFSGAEGIEVSRDSKGRTLAYVATGQGLDIVDVSDPAQPKAVAHLEGQREIRDALVQRGVLYLALADGGLALYGSGQ